MSFSDLIHLLSYSVDKQKSIGQRSQVDAPVCKEDQGRFIISYAVIQHDREESDEA
jgi:hypothetical protein